MYKGPSRAITFGLLTITVSQAAHPLAEHEDAVLPQHHDHAHEESRAPQPMRTLVSYVSSASGFSTGAIRSFDPGTNFRSLPPVINFRLE